MFSPEFGDGITNENSVHPSSPDGNPPRVVLICSLSASRFTPPPYFHWPQVIASAQSCSGQVRVLTAQIVFGGNGL